MSAYYVRFILFPLFLIPCHCLLMCAAVSGHARLIFKDAVYCELFDSLDFDTFLVNRLSQEICAPPLRHSSCALAFSRCTQKGSEAIHHCSKNDEIHTESVYV